MGGTQGIDDQFSKDVADEVVEFGHVVAEEFGEEDREGDNGASDGTTVFEEEAVNRVEVLWTVSARMRDSALVETTI